MENLQAFQCKYCQRYFHRFDSWKRHTSRHGNKQPHRTLHFKCQWKGKATVESPKMCCKKGSHRLSNKNVHSRQRQKTYQEREQLNYKQKPANQMSVKQKHSSNQGRKGQQRLLTFQKKGRQSKQRQTHSSKTSELKPSQDNAAFPIKFSCIGKLFKSQCQKKYDDIKTMSSYNQFSCLNCRMYGFTNEREVYLHEKMSKHCAYCKKLFLSHEQFVKHSQDRQAYESNTTRDLCVVQSNEDSSYYNLHGHEVFKCHSCKYIAWFTESGYIEHKKIEHGVCQCFICQTWVIVSHTQKHLKSRKHLENVRALSTSQSKTNTAWGIDQSVGNSKENRYKTAITKGNGMTDQVNQFPCKCDVCNQECPSYCFYNWHIESHKFQMVPFICFNCSQSFFTKKDLIEHEVAKSHCSYCGEQFDTEIELMGHRTETIAEGNKYRHTVQIPVVMKDNSGVAVETGQIRKLSLETPSIVHSVVEGNQDYSSLPQNPAVVVTSHTAHSVFEGNQDNSSLLQKPTDVEQIPVAMKDSNGSQGITNTSSATQFVENSGESVHETTLAKGYERRDQSQSPLPYICDMCNQVCPSYCFYNWHIESHKTPSRFICYNCSQSFASKKDLIQHEVAKSHCSYCGEQFDTEIELMGHRTETIAEGNKYRHTVQIPVVMKDNSGVAVETGQIRKLSLETPSIVHSVVEGNQDYSSLPQNPAVVVTSHTAHSVFEGNQDNSSLLQKPTDVEQIPVAMKDSNGSQGITNTSSATQFVENSGESVHETTLAKGYERRDQSQSPLPYICDMCNQVCPSYCFYNWHIESHKTPSRFICYNCSQSFASKKDLIQHEVAKSHCSYCGVQFVTEIELMGHRTETIAEGNKYRHKYPQIPVVVKGNNGSVMATRQIRQTPLETLHTAHSGVKGNQDCSSLPQNPADVIISHTAQAVVGGNQDHSSLPQIPIFVTFEGNKLVFASKQCQKKGTVALIANEAGSYHTSERQTQVVIKDSMWEMAGVSPENVRPAIPEGKNHSAIGQTPTVVKDIMGAVVAPNNSMRKETPTPVAITRNDIKERNGVKRSEQLVSSGKSGQKTILVPSPAICRSNCTVKCVSSGSPAQVSATGPLPTAVGQVGISSRTGKDSIGVTKINENTSATLPVVTNAPTLNDKQLEMSTESKSDVLITKNKSSYIAIKLPYKNGKDIIIGATIPSGFKAKDVDMRFGTAMVQCLCQNCNQSFQCKRHLVLHEVFMKHCAYCDACFTSVADLLAHRVARHKI